MSIHVCKCEHNGREEWHLRYPGMTKESAQELADKINGGMLGCAERARAEEREACAKVCDAEENRVDGLTDKVVPDGNLYLAGKAMAAHRCAKNIRERSNA